MKRLLAAASLLVFCGVTSAQTTRGKYVWETYADRIQASQAVAPLGDDLFGDRIGLSKGELSFVATDATVPTDGVPMALERQYVVSDRRWRSTTGMLADWDFNLPSIGAVFNPNWVVQAGQSDPVSTARCSVVGRPPITGPFDDTDFWHGVQLNIPGQEGGEILRAPTSVTLQDGRSYPWVTGSNAQIRLTCLPTIKNGDGEGFLAVTPDGTKYWFDWMAQTIEPGISKYLTAGQQSFDYFLPLRRNVLYATRIEDRFGNATTLTYTNAWNAPAKLTKMENGSNSINLIYAGNFVTSAWAGTQTWTYQYASTPSGRTTLTSVTRPDGSKWQINFHGLTHGGEIKYPDYVPGGEIVRTCVNLNQAPDNVNASFTGTLTHPSGAVGTFVLALVEHGRTNVPISCKNVTSTVGQPLGASNNPNDDINLWATKAYSLTLMQKQISGAGLTSAVWNYSYVPSASIYMYPGTTIQYPVCDWTNYQCGNRPCSSDICAGTSKTIVTGPGTEWARYTYGNSYRYNEGKLLKVERGMGEQDVLSKITNEYDFLAQNQPYPETFGFSLSSGDDFQASYHRPLRKTTTVQQGTAFTYEVTGFDSYARPTTVVRSSGPAPVDPPPVIVDPPTAPPVPTLTAPPYAAATSPYTVSWTASAGATYYVLERSANNGISFSVVYLGADTSTSVITQFAGIIKFRVKACNDNVCSSYSFAKSTTVETAGGGGMEP